MERNVTIAGRSIGIDHPPYVICELSANHKGSLNRALEMIEAAAKTGCDAIKLQTYTPDTLTINHDSSDFLIKGGLWDGRSLYDLYKEAQTPFEWHALMFEKARELGVTIFSTPFDETAADMLDELGAPAFKIASFEVTDLPLIEHVAHKGKPMIISTGLANLAEIEAAVGAARNAGCDDLIVLHCISSYPAPSSDANLRTIPHLAETFNVISGLSDHTLGTATSVAAIAIGAAVIEKHFTIARRDGGPDASFSLEPNEFAGLCQDCQDAWASLGRVHYDIKGSERSSLTFRRSLYIVEPVKAGAPITRQSVRSIRPGFGLPPRYLPDVIGTRAARDLSFGEPLDWSMIVR